MVMLYKDIASKAENVLRDDYDFSRKLKIKTKAANGVSFTTEGDMSSNKSIVAKLSGSFAHASSGVVFKKLQVTTHGRLISEAEVPNIFIKGLKVTAKVEDGSVAKNSHAKRIGIFGWEYQHVRYSVDGAVDIGSKIISKSATYRFDNILLGAQTAFNYNKSAFVDHNAAVSYRGNDYMATLQTKKKFNMLSGSFYHHLSHDTVYSAIFNYDLKSGQNTLSVGGRYNADKLTTYAGKIESDGKVSLALVQKIRPFLALTTSAHVDVTNFDGDAHKFGIGLTLG
ncbi:uncharacterized protein CCR75_008838 [Bremia lactucae]|uniref:Voltage-dependent anion-selective channel protein n=1 Tax=Bremia lactucae TaxID=4779 RepID=A0A976FGU9_BRELC|nr:hypothetical protein CCR75_008838 [Bremia lactucae]